MRPCVLWGRFPFPRPVLSTDVQIIPMRNFLDTRLLVSRIRVMAAAGAGIASSLLVFVIMLGCWSVRICWLALRASLGVRARVKLRLGVSVTLRASSTRGAVLRRPCLGLGVGLRLSVSMGVGDRVRLSVSMLVGVGLRLSLGVWMRLGALYAASASVAGR